VIANNDFYRRRANATIAEGNADMIAFGEPFISNPDLVIRLCLRTSREPFFRGGRGGEEKYIDYQVLGWASRTFAIGLSSAPGVEATAANCRRCHFRLRTR
jgi:hypothetical protein